MGESFEPCSLVCKEEQLKTSLAFSTQFIPVRLVIKLKIHVPPGLLSVLSTNGCILEPLWFAPSEVWAGPFHHCLSDVPQYLLCGHRGFRGAGSGHRGAGTPQAVEVEDPWDCRGYPRYWSPRAADS